MHSFFHGIMSIFFDMSKYGEGTKDIYDPQDLTDHYKNEIQDMYLDKIYVATHYKDIIHSIEAYKYKSDRHHASKYVDLLANVVDTYGLIGDKNNLSIIAVPMHWSRYLIRGFNHIDYLVSHLSKKIGIPHKRPLQAFFTRRQSKLSKSNRMKNREYAFGLKLGQDLPKTIILIDDIISTGSTANACAKILKSAGVEKIYGVFIASNQ